MRWKSTRLTARGTFHRSKSECTHAYTLLVCSPGAVPTNSPLTSFPLLQPHTPRYVRSYQDTHQGFPPEPLQTDVAAPQLVGPPERHVFTESPPSQRTLSPFQDQQTHSRSAIYHFHHRHPVRVRPLYHYVARYPLLPPRPCLSRAPHIHASCSIVLLGPSSPSVTSFGSRRLVMFRCFLSSIHEPRNSHENKQMACTSCFQRPNHRCADARCIRGNARLYRIYAK